MCQRGWNIKRMLLCAHYRNNKSLELIWCRVLISVRLFDWEQSTRCCSWFTASCYVGILLPSSWCHLCHDTWAEHRVLPSWWIERVQTGITQPIPFLWTKRYATSGHHGILFSVVGISWRDGQVEFTWVAGCILRWLTHIKVVISQY